MWKHMSMTHVLTDPEWISFEYARQKTKKNNGRKLVGVLKFQIRQKAFIRATYSHFFFVVLVYFQTALHWAAKHGNEDVVKLIAGKCKADVNARTVRPKSMFQIAWIYRFFIFSLLVSSHYMSLERNTFAAQNGVSRTLHLSNCVYQFRISSGWLCNPTSMELLIGIRTNT